MLLIVFFFFYFWIFFLGKKIIITYKNRVKYNSDLYTKRMATINNHLYNSISLKRISTFQKRLHLLPVHELEKENLHIKIKHKVYKSTMNLMKIISVILLGPLIFIVIFIVNEYLLLFQNNNVLTFYRNQKHNKNY